MLGEQEEEWGRGLHMGAEAGIYQVWGKKEEEEKKHCNSFDLVVAQTKCEIF